MDEPPPPAPPSDGATDGPSGRPLTGPVPGTSTRAPAGEGDAEDTDGQPAGDPVALRRLATALLVTSRDGLQVATLAAAAGVSLLDADEALRALARACETADAGVRCRETVHGWRLFAAADLTPSVEAAVRADRPPRLSQAALETLAVIAYTQPTSRARIAAVRGVSVDAVVRTLLARDMIAEVGEDAGSGALVYGTTDHFLERLGLTSLSQLPPLGPLLPHIETIEAMDDHV